MAFEADAVEAMQYGTVAGGNDVRRNILDHCGFAADESIIANSDKLMDRHKTTDGGVVADGDMACQRRVVGQYHHFSDPAVMGNMRVCHQKRFLSHLCKATAGFRAAVNGDELPDGYVRANSYTAFFSAELQILGDGADGRELKNPASGTDVHLRIDDHMGADKGPLADGHILADN